MLQTYTFEIVYVYSICTVSRLVCSLFWVWNVCEYIYATLKIPTNVWRFVYCFRELLLSRDKKTLSIWLHNSVWSVCVCQYINVCRDFFFFLLLFNRANVKWIFYCDRIYNYVSTCLNKLWSLDMWCSIYSLFAVRNWIWKNVVFLDRWATRIRNVTLTHRALLISWNCINWTNREAFEHSCDRVKHVHGNRFHNNYTKLFMANCFKCEIVCISLAAK